jgi:uncharacterized membrane protein YgcG
VLDDFRVVSLDDIRVEWIIQPTVDVSKSSARVLPVFDIDGRGSDGRGNGGSSSCIRSCSGSGSSDKGSSGGGG